MRNVATLTKRELMAYFLSPMAYIILTVFLLLSGYLFFEFLTFSRRADMSGIIGFMAWLGFVATVSIASNTYEQRPFRVFLINNVYLLVALMIMGAIIAAWQGAPLAPMPAPG